MLLVMSTAGIFKPPNSFEGNGGGTDAAGIESQMYPSHQSPRLLWDLTWNRIESFLPNLHGELFPDVAVTPNAGTPATVLQSTASANSPAAGGTAPAAPQQSPAARTHAVGDAYSLSVTHGPSPGLVGTEHAIPGSPATRRTAYAPLTPTAMNQSYFLGTPDQDNGFTLPMLQFSSTPTPTTTAGDQGGTGQHRVVLSPIPLSMDVVGSPLSVMADDMAAAVMGDVLPRNSRPSPATTDAPTRQQQDTVEVGDDGLPLHHLPIIV